MKKRDITITCLKKTLQLNNNVHIIKTEILNENNEVTDIRISFDLPKNEIKEYLNKWATIRNAYKYRKR